jgi:hypothetical protein
VSIVHRASVREGQKEEGRKEGGAGGGGGGGGILLILRPGSWQSTGDHRAYSVDTLCGLNHPPTSFLSI